MHNNSNILNSRIAEYGLFEIISDQILTTETVGVPILTRGGLNSGITQWTENSDFDSPYSFIVRVFYVKENRTRIYGSEGATVGGLK